MCIRDRILHRALDQLGVAGSLADAHVHHDLDQPRHLVDVAVGELFAQRRHDLFGVARLQAGCCSGRRRLTHAMSLPERLATRTRTVRVRPSRSISSVRWPTRVPFLVSGSTSITLLMWIGASSVSIPPVRVPVSYTHLTLPAIL